MMGNQLIKTRLMGPSSPLRVYTVPCLRDNYAWIIQDVKSGCLAVVDTPSAKPIISKLQELGVPDGTNITILNTHHHRDHTSGNEAIKREFKTVVYGPAKEKIPAIDHKVQEGDVIKIGDSSCRVIDIPGHTCGHVGYVFDHPGIVFVGDTLFGHGCGALFEGSYSQMWNSITKIISLPPSTLMFCAHEYTEYNVMFARTVFPNDQQLDEVLDTVVSLRQKGEQTVPSLLGQELLTNPFLRCRIPEIQSRLGATNAIEAFRLIREGKNIWKSPVS
jgi:hydroxyacylglutathione hydrolase